MSKSEDNDSPPMIFTETTKLLQSMETNEEKIYKTKCLLNHKQTYYEELQQHENRLNKSVAEKHAALSIVNDRTSLVNAKNSCYREKGKEICTSCNAAQQDINEIEAAFADCEDKIDNMSKNLDESNSQYEKKIDELIKLLDQLTEKRKTMLDALQVQEKELQEENLLLNNQSLMYEKEEALINAGDISDIGELENELKDLQSKLSVLNEDYAHINKKDQSCKMSKEDMEKKYNESVYAGLETRSEEIINDIERLSEAMGKQSEAEQETVVAYQTLEDYERKLDEELTQTAKFWEDLERNQYGGFSGIEQEIGKIRADIIERNEKYGAEQHEKAKLVETLKKKDDEIEKLNSTVEQITTQLKEVESFLETLKSSDDLSEQYNKMLHKISILHNEKTLLEKCCLEKEESVQKLINQLGKDKEKAELEILSLENTNLMEAKEQKKIYDDLEADKMKLEKEVKSTENKMKELEDAKTSRKEKSESLSDNHKKVDKIIEEGQRNLKMIIMKKEETKKQLINFAVPPPIYVRKSDTSRDFVKPKTPEPPKKKSKKVQSPKAKRNWDSDSSVEGEEVKLIDVLKKKHRRQQEFGK